MKRYSMTSLRAYSPAEDPAGEWVRYEDAQEEITRLRQRVAELEDGVMELEEQNRILSKALDNAGKIIEQRGERMRDLRGAFREIDWYHFTCDRPEAADWFDETGEPL